MSEIADFLRARYAERRALTEAMPRGPWTWAKAESDTGTYDSLSGPDEEVLSSGDADGYRSWIEKHEALDAYLGIIQPEQITADLDAKLALIDEHPDVNDGSCGTCIDAAWGYPTHGGSTPAAYPCRTLRLLGQPFAGHPDHKGEEWAP